MNMWEEADDMISMINKAALKKKAQKKDDLDQVEDKVDDAEKQVDAAEKKIEKKHILKKYDDLENDDNKKIE